MLGFFSKSLTKRNASKGQRFFSFLVLLFLQYLPSNLWNSQRSKWLLCGPQMFIVSQTMSVRAQNKASQLGKHWLLFLLITYWAIEAAARFNLEGKPLQVKVNAEFCARTYDNALSERALGCVLHSLQLYSCRGTKEIFMMEAFMKNSRSSST